MVHREVIIDLLPVYLSGEASAATRDLVEAAIKADPELAKLVERERNLLVASPPPPLPADQEMRVLDRTKRVMRWRTMTLVAAYVFTVVPFTFSWESGKGFRLLMWQSFPQGCIALWLIAVTLWITHIALRIRSRRIGI